MMMMMVLWLIAAGCAAYALLRVAAIARGKLRGDARGEREVRMGGRIAHRGGREHTPENTLIAFENSSNGVADCLELDVWLTKDNEVVVFHDGHLVSGFFNRSSFEKMLTLVLGCRSACAERLGT